MINRTACSRLSASFISYRFKKFKSVKFVKFLEKKTMYKLNILGLSGFLLLVLGATLLTFKASIEELAISKLLKLHPNSPIFQFWKKLPVEVPTNVYFFNWTNKEDFYNLDAKVKLEEVGPYKFQQTIERLNITWNNQNDTLTFKQVHSFRYDEENEHLNDTITTIDYLYMATAHYIRHWSEFVKLLSSNYLETLDLNYFLTKTAAEHSLDGFESPIMTTASYISFLAPEFPIFEKFGWIKLFHGDGYFNSTFTISNGINRNFDLVRWNYENKTKHFDGPCNEIRGSLGDLQTFTNKDYIEVFVPHICRYVQLEFEKEEMVDGILGHKYSAQDMILDNGTKISDNKCFGTTESTLPSGLINISSCHRGFNGYVSLPHFYKADPIYLSKIEGLKPEKSKHETFLIVEPKTFLPLKFAIRAQINTHVHPVTNVNAFESAPNLYFPIVWIEQSLDLPEQLKTYIRQFLKLSFGIFAASAVSITLGIFLLLFVAYKYKDHKRKEDKTGCLVEEIAPLKYADMVRR